MPLYEYKCSKCEKIHEVMQKFSDPALETCPECGGSVSKLMSLTSFALKGSGWYTTDYKRQSSSSTTQEASKPESKTEGSASTPQPKEAKDSSSPAKSTSTSSS